ncbi:MAG: sulfotransferase family protein [Steroidobacter sp.]
MPKSLMILSHKSCGSSACLRVLASAPGVRTIAHTRHFQNESLYWTKAASMLGLPQLKMHASEIPIPGEKAKQDLLDLLRANAPAFYPPENEETLVFEGWRALCHAHEPVFIEKSPHHLYQISCLDLMREATTRLPDIQFHFIGLIRNPMDVVYSQWQRWRSLPEKVQDEWVIAYRNLQKFKVQMGERVTLVRYEDLVQCVDAMEPILRFCGAEQTRQIGGDLHQRSVARWRKDSRFGFGLSSDAFQLARDYGYSVDELPERRASTKTWPLLRGAFRAAHSMTWPIRHGRSLVRRVVRTAAR